MHGVVHCVCVFVDVDIVIKPWNFVLESCPESLNVTMNTNNLHKLNVIENIYIQIINDY